MDAPPTPIPQADPGAGYRAQKAEIDAAVADANRAVSQAEAIKKYRVLATDFTEDNGMLTPSLKLKRSVVMKEFGNEVEGLYAR